MKIRKEVKVGIVTAIALGCFLFGFNFLKGKNFFKKQRIFYAAYENIDGLVPANPLMINGFKVGMVGDIKLDMKRKGKVIVSLVVEDDIPIPLNSIAKVVSSDILGSKAVTILLGSSPSPANIGDTLLSDQEETLKQQVNQTIAPLQQKAQKLIGSIDSVMVVIQQVFNDNTKKNLAKSFESIKDAIGSLETTSFRLDTMVVTEKVKISSILTKVNKLATTLADNSEKLSNVINNFSNISDTIAKSNLKSAINNADVALREAASVLSKINKGEGTMGMLVNDNKLYVKLDSSSVQLERLLKDLRMNPERYVHVSVFGRKDKHKPKY